VHATIGSAELPALAPAAATAAVTPDTAVSPDEANLQLLHQPLLLQLSQQLLLLQLPSQLRPALGPVLPDGHLTQRISKQSVHATIGSAELPAAKFAPAAIATTAAVTPDEANTQLLH
jgi:hypothetical protein